MGFMKPDAAKPPGYESKPTSYFEHSRSEMLPFIPAGCRRALDVGCGQGTFGQLLKRTRGMEVWGIEPVAAAAAIAATRLDCVIEGAFSAEADLPEGKFDVITFNDVLEHLMEPGAALRLAARILNPGGVVVASIPNIRHFPTLWEVVVRGEWQYTDSGILDRTHVRFFTRKSIGVLFSQCDFQVERIRGINSRDGGTARKWFCYDVLNALVFNAIEDMRYLQFAVVAKPVRNSHES